MDYKKRRIAIWTVATLSITQIIAGVLIIFVHFKRDESILSRRLMDVGVVAVPIIASIALVVVFKWYFDSSEPKELEDPEGSEFFPPEHVWDPKGDRYYPVAGQDNQKLEIPAIDISTCVDIQPHMPFGSDTLSRYASSSTLGLASGRTSSDTQLASPRSSSDLLSPPSYRSTSSLLSHSSSNLTNKYHPRVPSSLSSSSTPQVEPRAQTPSNPRTEPRAQLSYSRPTKIPPMSLPKNVPQLSVQLSKPDQPTKTSPDKSSPVIESPASVSLSIIPDPRVSPKQPRRSSGWSFYPTSPCASDETGTLTVTTGIDFVRKDFEKSGLGFDKTSRPGSWAKALIKEEKHSQQNSPDSLIDPYLSP